MTVTILNFSDAAIAHLSDMIAKKGDGFFFRMRIQETGCTGLMYVPEITDKKACDDVAQKITDSLTIYVAKDAIDAIKGTKIDYISVSLGQKQLSYDNPNADSLCGCGESFNLKDKGDKA